MRERPPLKHATIGIVLLLGACAGGGAAPEIGPAVRASAHVELDESPTRAADAPTLAAIELDRVLPAAGADCALPASRSEGTEVAYVLLDLESGDTLAERSAHLPLIPASTTKLATAIVALDVLGPEHRYLTELLTRGVIHDGVLRGDLILRGDGDPGLDVPDLLGLAVRLQTRGVRRVEGQFLIDDTALPRFSEIHPLQPAEAAYNPGIGALSLAFNRVQVAWRGGEVRKVASLPPLDAVRFEVAPPSLLPPAGVALEIAGDETVVWRVADRGDRRQEISLPVKDPGLHTGHMFRRLALAQGIELAPPQRGAAPPEAELLTAHESAPLRHLLRDMLVHSNNMMAEVIALSAAGRLGDEVVPTTAAGDLLLAHLRRILPEVDWCGAALGNGSGLDGTSRLTPRQLAAIARYGWRTAALPALLAGGGWSGTLASRFTGTGEALRVWAKTGTVHYGSALAGFLFPGPGRPAVFVVMVSEIGARDAYDAGPHRARPADAAAWSARARVLQDDLVKGWLRPLPTS